MQPCGQTVSRLACFVTWCCHSLKLCCLLCCIFRPSFKFTWGALSIDEGVSLIQSVCSGNSSSMGFFLLPQQHSSTDPNTVRNNKRLLEDKVGARLACNDSWFGLHNKVARWKPVWACRWQHGPAKGLWICGCGPQFQRQSPCWRQKKIESAMHLVSNCYHPCLIFFPVSSFKFFILRHGSFLEPQSCRFCEIAGDAWKFVWHRSCKSLCAPESRRRPSFSCAFSRLLVRYSCNLCSRVYFHLGWISNKLRFNSAELLLPVKSYRSCWKACQWLMARQFWL